MNSDGVLNINKPENMTSFQCANRVRKITGVKKAGHAGTLDPNATGVLPVCINKGTKCMDFFLNMGKSYIGKIKFGASTDTMDAWGVTLEEGNPELATEEKLLEVMENFKGEILQLPPQYSAIKKDGVPLYKLARKGIFTEIEPRKITVYQLKLLSFDFEKHEAEIYVHCSKGTYIRVLINDICEEIGCHGHMAALQRTSYGFLKIENSITLEQLKEICQENKLTEYINPIEKLTENFGNVSMDDNEWKDFKDGKIVMLPKERINFTTDEKRYVNLFYRGELTAVSEAEETDEGVILHPWKYFGSSKEA